MEKFIKKYRYFPIILTVILYTLFFNRFQSIASDEAFYLNVARDIVEGRGYTGITNTGEALAPVFSFIIAIFYFVFGISDLSAKLVDPLFTILNTILIFVLARKLFNEKVAFFSSIFLSTLPVTIILGERILLEQVHLFFLLLLILFFIKSVKENSKLLPIATIFFILAFFTRYAAAAFAFSFIFYFLFEKRKFLEIVRSKYLFLSSLILILSLTPFFYLSYLTYGNPLTQFTQLIRSYTVTTAEEPQHFYLTNFALIPAFITPMFIVGVYHSIKFKNKILIWFLLSILFLVFYRFALLPVRELRYLIDTVPFISIVSAVGFLEIVKMEGRKFYALIMLFVLVSLNITAGFYAISSFASSPRYNEVKEASLWLKANCSEPVLSNAGRHVRYYAGFDELSLTTKNLEKYKNADCILYSEYEPVEKAAVESIVDLNVTEKFGRVFVYKMKPNSI